MTELREQLQKSLGEAYTLERELGGGGMSRVFIAEDNSLGRKVVVKVLLPDLAATVNIERFRREIQLAAKLQHPHIVPVLSAGISDGLPYYTMPFIEGESLRARLSRSGELPVHDTARILRDVLSALSYAHEHGVVHRDMKPDNVLLTGNHAVVADFGVAKALSASTNPGSSLTSLGVALGTPAYMSPEQAAADPATDHRADLYGVGAMAYEMLTGQQVFSARSPQAMLAAHATQKPEAIDVRRPSVPRELSSLIMRSLEKHAADRPQSAAEMLADLEAAVTPSGATTPHIGAIAPRRAYPSSRRGTFMAVGSAIVILLLASSTAYWRTHRSVEAGPVVVADSTPSLAVLPFDNLGNKDDAYFADGMTDEISSKLGGVGGLIVIGRQSAKSYANTTKPPQQIGKELGATYLLTGTVRWDRSRNGRNLVKITPVLLRSSSGAEIWSEPYQAEATNVFDIQGKVAEHVAEAMRVKLSQSDKTELASRPTVDAQAYDYFLRGKMLSAVTATRPSDYLRAAAFLQHAVERDPKFALAYAHLGNAHLNAFWWQADDSPHRLAMAKAAIDTALALDPRLAAGYMAKATYYYRAKLDYAKALETLLLAEKISPNDPELLYLKGLIERRQNKWDEAIKDQERSAQLDPRNVRYAIDLCTSLVVTRHYPEARGVCEGIISLAPDRLDGYARLSSLILLSTGDVNKAVAILKHAKGQVDPDQWKRGVLVLNWPGLTDPELRRDMEEALSAKEDQNRMDFLLARLTYSVYMKNKPAQLAFADSMIAEAPKGMRGNYLDALLHSYLSEAYAAKGDRQRSLEEGRLSLQMSPLSADAVGASNNLGSIASSAVLAGSYDEAITYLEQLLAIPSWLSVPLLRVDPWFDQLRGNPRFERLLAR
jgi:TolB-like protein/tRNA A-37 threonylcarbamoyl transferase component Bud32